MKRSRKVPQGLMDVRTLKVIGVLGLGIDFLFHWAETGTVLGLLLDAFNDVELELGGAWTWGMKFLALGAHILFIIGFLALIALPLKVEKAKSPWDGLKQVAQAKESFILILVVALLMFSALAVTFKALGMWPFDERWLYSG